MPRTKPDPVEVKRTTVRRKIFFVGLIVALVGLTNAFMVWQGSQPQRSTSTAQQKPQPAPTGLHKEKQLISEVASSAQKTSAQVLGAATAYMDNAKAKANESFHDAVFNTTIKPIIDHFESLPEDQQKSVKQAICVAPSEDPTPTPEPAGP